MASRDRTSELRSQTTVYVSNQSIQRQDSFSQKLSSIDQRCDQLERNILNLKDLHQESVLCVGNDQLRDSLTKDTNQEIHFARSELQQLSNFKDPSRKVRQTRLAKRLQDIISRLSQVQKEAKEKQQKRLEREYRIARPDLTEPEILELVEHGIPGEAFQLTNQKRVLNQVKDRHQELLAIEKSIEELATLFMDLQTMLMAQDETIQIIETQVDDIVLNIIRGDDEVKKAVEIRKKSRNKLWIITGIIFLVLVIVALVVYFQFFNKK